MNAKKVFKLSILVNGTVILFIQFFKKALIWTFGFKILILYIFSLLMILGVSITQVICVFWKKKLLNSTFCYQKRDKITWEPKQIILRFFTLIKVIIFQFDLIKLLKICTCTSMWKIFKSHFRCCKFYTSTNWHFTFI